MTISVYLEYVLKKQSAYNWSSAIKTILYEGYMNCAKANRRDYASEYHLLKFNLERTDFKVRIDNDE